ncbi:MAG: S-layer homology domain-containing protein [Oscillospiraceae bacterium]
MKKLTALCLALALMLGTAVAAPAPTLEAALENDAAYLLRSVPAPAFGSIGGEWVILGLARGICPVPEGYFEGYYRAVEETVRAQKGVLDRTKNTEYARVALALTAIGRDPRTVGGYNLLLPLGDYEKTLQQGINGPAWALLALDGGDYPMPENKGAKTQATRPMYVAFLLNRQLADGGFSLANDGTADADVTGMVLQALARYRDQPAVKTAIDRALACVSKLQQEDGGFTSWGQDNCESVVQLICALGELEIPMDDPRFVKNGNTMLDNLLTYYRPGKGFFHTQQGDGSDQMAAEQGLCALVSARRLRDKTPSFYHMTDQIHTGAEPAAPGLPGKHQAVHPLSVTAPGKTFPDIGGDPNQQAIETMARHGILGGRDTGLFDPDGNMNRAEFAATAVKALDLTPAAGTVFSDVPKTAWYAKSVGTANAFGIVNGVGGGKMNPQGTITRQEAAVMVANAAGLCGLNVVTDGAAVRDVLSPFDDYKAVEPWAAAQLAFCYQSGILDDSAMTIQPGKPCTRSEIAGMFCKLLERAKLL